MWNQAYGQPYYGSGVAKHHGLGHHIFNRHSSSSSSSEKKRRRRNQAYGYYNQPTHYGGHGYYNQPHGYGYNQPYYNQQNPGFFGGIRNAVSN